MFKKENIYLDLEVKNTQELFEKMNSIFLEKGYVKQGYLESLLKREKEYPTGLMFENYNVAIPHTDYSLINEQNIVFVRLKNKIKFGEMGTLDNSLDVKVVMFLLIKIGENQVDVLLRLMKFFESYENYKLLETSNDKELILKTLKGGNV